MRSATWLFVLVGLSTILSLCSGQAALYSVGQGFAGQLGRGLQELGPIFSPGFVVDDVSAVSAGGDVSGYASEGRYFTFGEGTNGRTGHGSEIDRYDPSEIIGLGGPGSLYVGLTHSLLARADGTIYAWGKNNQEQLGIDDGDTDDRLFPVLLPSPLTGTLWTQFFLGEGWSMGIQSLQLYSWGVNVDGVLGRGLAPGVVDPTPGVVNGTWSDVCGGSSHAVALGTDGVVSSWGLSDGGRLGLGTPLVDSNVPVAITLAVSASPVPSFSKITCGESNTIATAVDGSLWGWGSNNLGQLAVGTTVQFAQPVELTFVADALRDGEVAAQVAMSRDYAVLVTDTGRLLAWGSSQSGRNGLDGTVPGSNSLLPRAAPWAEPTEDGYLGEVQGVAVGHSHMLVLIDPADPSSTQGGFPAELLTILVFVAVAVILGLFAGSAFATGGGETMETRLDPQVAAMLEEARNRPVAPEYASDGPLKDLSPKLGTLTPGNVDDEIHGTLQRTSLGSKGTVGSHASKGSKGSKSQEVHRKGTKSGKKFTGLGGDDEVDDPVSEGEDGAVTVPLANGSGGALADAYASGGVPSGGVGGSGGEGTEAPLDVDLSAYSAYRGASATSASSEQTTASTQSTRSTESDPSTQGTGVGSPLTTPPAGSHLMVAGKDGDEKKEGKRKSSSKREKRRKSSGSKAKKGESGRKSRGSRGSRGSKGSRGSNGSREKRRDRKAVKVSSSGPTEETDLGGAPVEAGSRRSSGRKKRSSNGSKTKRSSDGVPRKSHRKSSGGDGKSKSKKRKSNDGSRAGK